MASSSGGYTRLNTNPSANDSFVHDTMRQQQTILEIQDENLDKMGESLRTIKDMSTQIGYELGEQSEMLDELGTAMSSTDLRMNNLMKKIAKLSHLEDEDRQCTAILVLFGLIVVLLIILVL